MIASMGATKTNTFQLEMINMEILSEQSCIWYI